MTEFEEITKKIREIFESSVRYDDINIVYILSNGTTKEFKIDGNGCALYAKNDLDLAIKEFKLTHLDGTLNVM